MAKAASADVSRVTDHDLHSRAVALCSQHNASSKLLQKALDQRHETVIKRFARLQDEAAVMQAWAEARGATKAERSTRRCRRSWPRSCRQLGKPWLPLRSSGLGSFLAALAEPAK